METRKIQRSPVEPLSLEQRLFVQSEFKDISQEANSSSVAVFKWFPVSYTNLTSARDALKIFRLVHEAVLTAILTRIIHAITFDSGEAGIGEYR